MKIVIYYVSDYSPSRYPQKWFNDLYLVLDRFCCYHADYIWDVSKAMHPARIEYGLDKNKSAPVIHTPNALFPEQVCPKPLNEIKKNTIVYAGTLNKFNGPDLAVSAMAHVLKKYPKAELHLYGGNGKDKKRLRRIIQKAELGSSVVFHGFVTDAIELSRKISRYSVGVAPYLAIPGSHRQYGDATKLRLYLGAGLPIVTTPVPPLGKELAERGIALISEDSEESLAGVILKLFISEKRYRGMRKKAIAYAEKNIWEKTYSNSLARMEN